MSTPYYKLKSLLGWPFEIGRKYRLESGAYRHETTHGGDRTITVPAGYVCDLFTGVPNLRMPRGSGVLVSYRSFLGAGPRRRIWVSAAAVVHDWIYERARDDAGQWITFDDAQAMFREILKAEGWRMFRDLYFWGVSKLAVSRALWNRHNDGRPRA
jgi:hypothetical protein